MNNVYLYSPRELGHDYMRAVVGGGLCLAPLMVGVELAGGVWLLVMLGGVFAIYGLRTVLRQLTRVMVTDSRISTVGIWKTEIPWQALSDLSLAYFTTWRSGGKGWMQLRLKGNGRTMRLDSNLDGFDEVTRRAVLAARSNTLPLTDTTLRNLDSLGLSSIVESMA